MIIPAIVVFVAVLYAIGTFLFMVLWNWIAVGLFHAPSLTFWTALGLVLLISIIGNAFKK